MATGKVAISMDRSLLRRLDQLVGQAVFRSRSEAVQKAVVEKIELLDKTRLAGECAKLSPAEEQNIADLGLADHLSFSCSLPG
jgi:metal-responsive CopG/Arc/MetJ family transcriptional regulator